jgi:hypothetical protein
MFAARPVLESVGDATAPKIPPGTRLRGGTGLLGRQSDCPFQATATYRLRAEPWPATIIGLTPIERGTLVHATLDAFWRSVRSQAALLSMTPASLASSIDAAFECARSLLTPARWASLPSAVEATEKTCVSRLVNEWVREFDKDRPPFTVLDTERRASVSIAGYTLDVRLDRVDALASGGVAVIDYKTGLASAPPRWFEDRPQGVQIALYGAACEQAVPDVPVQALAYAQLRPGEMKAVGLASDERVWPALNTPATLKGGDVADWVDAQSQLRSRLTELVGAFGGGHAAISPRDPKKVCSRCGLRALCRIGSLADEGPSSGAERDDDG